MIIRVVRACVCGSDLWRYRNPEKRKLDTNRVDTKIVIVLKKLGKPLRRWNQVILWLSLLHMDVEFDACLAGFDGSCDNHIGNNLGGDFQAEYIRFHYANWALVKIPGQPSDYTE